MRCIIGILCKLTIGISVQVIKIFVNFFAISFSVTFQITAEIFIYTRMWASAQSDGRPSKWRPVFNATNFGWRPLLECRAVTLPRHEIRWNLLGCPKCANKSQPLEGRSSPYCEHMWGRHCCLTRLFSDCRQLWIYSPTNLCDRAQMANFGRFFASCTFSESLAARFSPAS